MTQTHIFQSSAFSRRGFLGVAGGAAALATLAACSSGGGSSSSDALKFWDMPWGPAEYSTAAQRVTESYAPSGSLPAAEYQVIQWSNFSQTFSSAIASRTGPAVSTGGGFQAFQFAEQGAIAYADDLLERFKADGTYDDFLPGTIESLNTPDGYAAIPSALDMRVWWYNKRIFDENGLTVPTTWDEYFTVARALKAKGLFAFGSGAGANNNIGLHSMLVMMINNGGGLYNPDGELDVVNERNIEAMEFVRQLALEGIIDPASPSYSTDNLTAQWANGTIAMGINTPGLNATLGDTNADVVVAEPMASPSGEQGTLQFVNNLMMYTNTPSQEGSEEFLTYWIKNMTPLFQQNLQSNLPILKSLTALPEFQADTEKTKIINDWQPVAKTYAARSSFVDARLASIDGGQGLRAFAQTMLAGQTDPQVALEALGASLGEL
ncbi:ABC transporter substrate-binding protein [Rathayibacter sp. Leaf248]|uniref:ABC transporter substrate-binding protein n=1 Tax=Rathayibacter sp. Leaf248 TaxID=2876555 RepID=UPI001E61034B|nr:extracellular solute-binding protein [Rathayibacter sp. Leaf248]